MTNNNIGAILYKQKKKLVIKKLNHEYSLPQGYLLVKMIYSGICHTQLNEINGLLGRDRYLPHCMGHEGVGKILKVGSKKSKFKKGDLVVLSWIKKNSRKKYNPINFYSGKEKINSGGCNTLLKYTLASENRVYKLTNKKYLRESVLLGCALPTACNAIKKVSNLKYNSKILIMGMGGLGYSCLFVLNHMKIRDVTCIDNNKKRLKILTQKHTKFININKRNISEFIYHNHENFDLILDCTGSKDLIQKTFKLCKKYTGKFVIIGNTRINEKISLNTWDFIFGKTFTGAWGQGGTIMKNFKLNEKILISQIKNVKNILPKKNYNLTNINKAIDDFVNGKILRPIIKL